MQKNTFNNHKNSSTDLIIHQKNCIAEAINLLESHAKIKAELETVILNSKNKAQNMETTLNSIY